VKILQQLFRRHAEKDAVLPSVSGNGPTMAGASAIEEDGTAEREYEEFCQKFQFKPGERFMSYLAAHEVHQLEKWFHPSTAEPEPKAFIRLANDATQKGIEVWKQTSLEMYIHGRWSEEGGPSQESQECLSILAQILEMPITIYYRPAEDANMMFMTFEP
jgi:hypothetical protein